MQETAPDGDPDDDVPRADGAPGSEQGDLQPEELAQLLYQDLRRIAGNLFRRETPAQTLQPTALVHEAYVRLAAQRDARWESRAHFLAIAARTMRRVLVDAARARGSARRGGARERVTLIDAEGAPTGPAIDLVDLEAALAHLGQVRERYVRIVELRFFAGVGVEEIGELLGVSGRMIKKDWAKARSLLQVFLEDAAEA